MTSTFQVIVLNCLSVFLIFSFSYEAQSTVTVGSVSRGSNIVGLGINNNASVEVYAGVYGLESDCKDLTSLDAATFCDNCTTDITKPCNSNRIHPNLALNITYQSSVDGYPIAYLELSPSSQKLEFTDSVLDRNLVKANTVINISITWREICNEWKGSTDCKFNDDINLSIGVTSNQSGTPTDVIDSSNVIKLIVQGDNSGITNASANYCADPSAAAASSGACNFIAYAGDEKVFIEDIVSPTGFPSTSGDADFNAVRIYYKSGSWPSDPTASYSDLEVNATQSGTAVSLKENTIEGLKNDEEYFFSMATVDQAGNVSFFTGFNGSDTACVPGGPTPLCHQATPESVIGLLNGETDCFIATASFGSPFEKHVQDFRQFRNLYLNSSKVGKKIIGFYYQNSPPIARWIKLHPSSKPLIRWLLWPFWLFAKFCLLFGPTLLFGLISLLAIFYFLRKRKLRAKRV